MWLFKGIMMLLPIFFYHFVSAVPDWPDRFCCPTIWLARWIEEGNIKLSGASAFHPFILFSDFGVLLNMETIYLKFWDSFKTQQQLYKTLSVHQLVDRLHLNWKSFFYQKFVQIRSKSIKVEQREFMIK